MRVVELTGTVAANRDQLHSMLQEKLQLPEWYGRNLDALYDVLTSVEEETELVLIGWPDEGYAAKVRRVILDAVWENEYLKLKSID
ncbi:MAG: barstar family protein [Oscillospiraceae bacterium]|nr:barstar family protein [Oscillospiraceae bacterium]